jgi:hypothetical protein
MFNPDSNHNLLNNINNISGEIGHIYYNLNRINNQINQLYSIVRNQNQQNSTSIFNYDYPINNINYQHRNRPNLFYSPLSRQSQSTTQPIFPTPPPLFNNSTNINPRNSRNPRRNINRTNTNNTNTNTNTNNRTSGYNSARTVPTNTSRQRESPLSTTGNQNTTMRIPIFETSFTTLLPNNGNRGNPENQRLNQNNTDNMDIDDVEITLTTENDTVGDEEDDNPDDYYTETFNLNMNDRNDSLRNILSNIIAYRLATQTLARERTDNSRLSNLRDINNNTELEIFTSNEGDEEETCVVCREAIENNSIVRKIKKCGHYFHYKCLDKWLENHLTCPHCRQNIVEESEAEESTTLNNTTNTNRVNQATMI